jgi:hypothetical protein
LKLVTWFLLDVPKCLLSICFEHISNSTFWLAHSLIDPLTHSPIHSLIISQNNLNHLYIYRGRYSHEIHYCTLLILQHVTNSTDKAHPPKFSAGDARLQSWGGASKSFAERGSTTSWEKSIELSRLVGRNIVVTTIYQTEPIVLSVCARVWVWMWVFQRCENTDTDGLVLQALNLSHSADDTSRSWNGRSTFLCKNKINQ